MNTPVPAIIDSKLNEHRQVLFIYIPHPLRCDGRKSGAMRNVVVTADDLLDVMICPVSELSKTRSVHLGFNSAFQLPIHFIVL